MARNILISRLLPDEALAIIPPDVVSDLHASHDPLPRTDLIDRLHGKHGLICQVIDVIDEEVLAAAPGLKVVANLAVGYNNIDVAAAQRRGIVVTNTPDVLTETTADFAWALLMAAARRVVEADAYARSGRWARWDWDLLWGADVHGKTLGIIGFGRIGRAVARRARGFSMRVLYADAMRAQPAVEQELAAAHVDRDTLLREADFVSLHTPLLPDTRHLIDDRSLGLMKRTAILVNAARGPVVDEAALVRALAEGRIASAGLDVFEEEPPSAANPLFKLDNVVLTAHFAGPTWDNHVARFRNAFDNIERVERGEAPNWVVPELGL